MTCNISGSHVVEKQSGEWDIELEQLECSFYK